MYKTNLSIQALFTLQVYDSKHQLVRSSGESPNLVTQIGLESLVNGASLRSALSVGTSNTAPLPSDVTLGSRVATTSSTVSSTGGYNAANSYAYGRTVFRFAQGVAAGNIAEVGLTNSAGTQAFNRALVTDQLGAPTIIPVQSDEYLEVTVELRTYFATTTHTLEVKDKLGNVLDTIDVTIQPSFISNNVTGFASSGEVRPSTNGSWFTGTPTSITSIPTGSSHNIPRPTIATLSSTQIKVTVTLGLDAGNNVDLRTLWQPLSSLVKDTNGTGIAIVLSKPIRKNSTQQLTVEYVLDFSSGGI